jgi:hypothetical protein
MRSKLVLAALITLSTLPVFSQVAPAVKISGLPLGVGGGISDYRSRLRSGRRMIGASAWADYNLFHGLGIEAEGTSIFADKPDVLTRMKQETIKGGAIYKYHPIFRFRPYAKGLVGLGSIDFPSPIRSTPTTLIRCTLPVAERSIRVWKTLVCAPFRLRIPILV